MKKGLWVIAVLALLAACGRKTTPTISSTSDINRFQEDLSAVRPKYGVATGNPTEAKPEKPGGSVVGKSSLDVTRKVDALLDTMAVRNKNIRYAQGYRVQIYVGSNRQEAETVKTAAYQLFPDLKPYLIYAQPVYRVKAGDFLDRVEAEKYYVGFKAQYPNAIVVPDRVELRRNGAGN
ncbi:MAG: SPOR domain-containing protein [Ferruginibacter sp.]|nr:SPOR domain-containing protein [Cytophagales bacterium]